MKEKYKNYIRFSVLAALIILLVIFFIFVSPRELVDKLGVRNAYILTFLVSLFGGFSAGGSVSFISLLVAFVIGGLDPIFLGILAGIGLTIGDLIMFYIGSKGRDLITGKVDKKLIKFAKYFEEREWLKKLTPFLAYIYIAFMPLPNDLLILFLAAIKYPRNKMNWIIFFGDMTFPLMITLLAAKGVMIFV